MAVFNCLCKTKYARISMKIIFSIKIRGDSFQTTNCPIKTICNAMVIYKYLFIKKKLKNLKNANRYRNLTLKLKRVTTSS